MANHYRAPADMVMDARDKGPLDFFLPNCMINDYLNEEKKLHCLVNEYAASLRGQLVSIQPEGFDKWIRTVA